MTGMGDTSYDKYFLVGVDTNNQTFTPVNNNTTPNTVATNNSTSTTLSGKWILSACLLLLLALLI